MRKKDIDEIDLQILMLLSEDASISNRSLAETVGLTPPPTLVRVAKLKSRGIISGYTAEVNFDALGYDTRRFVTLIVNEDDCKFIKQELSELPWAYAMFSHQVNEVTGKVRLDVHFIAPSPKEFETSMAILKKSKVILDAHVYPIEEVVLFKNVFEITEDRTIEKLDSSED